MNLHHSEKAEHVVPGSAEGAVVTDHRGVLELWCWDAGVRHCWSVLTSILRQKMGILAVRFW